MVNGNRSLLINCIGQHKVHITIIMNNKLFTFISITKYGLKIWRIFSIFFYIYCLLSLNTDNKKYSPSFVNVGSFYILLKRDVRFQFGETHSKTKNKYLEHQLFGKIPLLDDWFKKSVSKVFVKSSQRKD